MSFQTIEIALPSDLIEQIDAEVGSARRSEFIARIASDAVMKKGPSQGMQQATTDEIENVPSKSRFHPVPIKGESASVTLLRDRGSY